MVGADVTEGAEHRETLQIIVCFVYKTPTSNVQTSDESEDKHRNTREIIKTKYIHVKQATHSKYPEVVWRPIPLGNPSQLSPLNNIPAMSNVPHEI